MDSPTQDRRDAMTDDQAKQLGYMIRLDESGRWYITITPAHVVNRRGAGYTSKSEALDALADALEPLT
jgi:hypothetical protein